MNERVRRLASVTAGAVLAIGALNVAVPAAEAAAYPVKPFTVKYGNTYATGQVTFYNQSVLVEVTVKATTGSGCRSVRATTFDKIELHDHFETQATCGTSPEYFSETLSASNKGGAAYVKVELLSYEGKTLASKNVNR
ncbi:hypothetical protein WEH80_37225 [Actinomycetes bacterium KLBMP 9759]